MRGLHLIDSVYLCSNGIYLCNANSSATLSFSSSEITTWKPAIWQVVINFILRVVKFSFSRERACQLYLLHSILSHWHDSHFGIHENSSQDIPVQQNQYCINLYVNKHRLIGVISWRAAHVCIIKSFGFCSVPLLHRKFHRNVLFKIIKEPYCFIFIYFIVHIIFPKSTSYALICKLNV